MILHEFSNFAQQNILFKESAAVLLILILLALYTIEKHIR